MYFDSTGPSERPTAESLPGLIKIYEVSLTETAFRKLTLFGACRLARIIVGRDIKS